MAKKGKRKSLRHRLNISRALRGKKRKKTRASAIKKTAIGVGAIGAIGGLGYLGYKKLKKNYTSVSPINTEGQVLKPKPLKPARERRRNLTPVDTDAPRTIDVPGTASIYQEQLPATTFPKDSKGKFKKKGKVKNGIMTGAESGFAPIKVEAQRDFDGKYEPDPGKSRAKNWIKHNIRGLNIWMRRQD